MQKTCAVTILAGLATVMATPLATAQQVASLPSTRPMTFDVAGVRLGATAADTKAALQRAGYRYDNPSTAATFEQTVRSEADRRLGRAAPFKPDAGVGRIYAHGPHREYAQIEFMQRPGGSVVSEITISIPKESITAADFKAQLMAKYGRPDAARAQGAELSWCSAEVMASCGLIYAAAGDLDTAYPNLKAQSYGDGGEIALSIGQRAFNQLTRDREAAVEALAPKSRQGAF